MLRQVDLGQVKELLLHPQRLPWLLAALLIFNASKIASALRLNVYQRHGGVFLSESENLRLYYAGMFLNLFLPGGIGGDGYKVLVLYRRQAASVKTLVTITLADRISGLLILISLLCLLLPIASLPWPRDIVSIAAALVFIGIVAVFMLSHRWYLKMNGSRLASVFGYGVAVQTLQLICMLLLLFYLKAPATHYAAYLAVFLVSSIAAVIPLSFGGLGAREVTFLFSLDYLGLDPAYGVVASTLFFLLTAISSIIGAFFLGRFRLAQ